MTHCDSAEEAEGVLKTIQTSWLPPNEKRGAQYNPLLTAGFKGGERFGQLTGRWEREYTVMEDERSDYVFKPQPDDYVYGGFPNDHSMVPNPHLRKAPFLDDNDAPAKEADDLRGFSPEPEEPLRGTNTSKVVASVVAPENSDLLGFDDDDVANLDVYLVDFEERLDI